MSIKWKPQDKEIYKGWIESIIEGGQDLNMWEKEFICCLYKKLQKFDLTENQAITLEGIYLEKTK